MGVGVVLGAWCYTRAAGTEVVHVATTGSISTAARGVDIQGAVINTMGSVGDGSDWLYWYTGVLVYWYTGVLVYWYTGIQSTQGVITSTLFIL